MKSSYNLTESDEKIRECLKQKKSFSVIAGAGSGKTTSLVSALAHLRDVEGDRLRKFDQKIVCITFTNRAVDVILDRLGHDELFRVSTLHKFLWDNIKNFTSNIRTVLKQEIIPKQIEKKQKESVGNSKKAIKARKKVVSLEDHLSLLDGVDKFIYSDENFSNYGKGKLNHDDVIEIAASLISSHELLRLIIGQKYPYIFVDESQDTFSRILDALNCLYQPHTLPVIGYFGDPMQQIYDNRAGDLRNLPNFEIIEKQENYRSSVEVIEFLNAFRRDLQQVPSGKTKLNGSVKICLVRAQTPAGYRNTYTDEQTDQALMNLDAVLGKWDWKDKKEVKQLFLTRQMIARRLGFPNLNKLFTGQYASSNAEDAYEKGEHFLIEPFRNLLVPLISAYCQKDNGTLLRILRNESSYFNPSGENAGLSLTHMINHAKELLEGLYSIWDDKTIREIFTFIKEKRLIQLSDRLNEHIRRSAREEVYDPDLHELEKGDWLADEFLNMRVSEVNNFCRFLDENTSYSTQHGAKGEEYDDVLVVLDDVEANWNNYSFSKMFTSNLHNTSKESQVVRTRKLAYVSFSRAVKNLRIIFFTPSPEKAREELILEGIFKSEQIEISL